MARYKTYIKALRKCAKEHENDIVPFGHIRTTDLCNVTADLLEKLEVESNKAIKEIKDVLDILDKRI